MGIFNEALVLLSQINDVNIEFENYREKYEHLLELAREIEETSNVHVFPPRTKRRSSSLVLNKQNRNVEEECVNWLSEKRTVGLNRKAEKGQKAEEEQLKEDDDDTNSKK